MFSMGTFPVFDECGIRSLLEGFSIECEEKKSEAAEFTLEELLRVFVGLY